MKKKFDLKKKITEDAISEFLKQKPDLSLFHREQTDLEFKESFNLAGLAEYFRDFAGFSNNSGGFIIFGVTNRPRRPNGLSKKSLVQFSSIDEERISGYINEHFAPYIEWEMDTLKIKGKTFGAFYAYQSSNKPVICKKGDDKQIIKNGEVYYRYAGRTEVIQYSELSNIIENRIKENNKQWIQKVKKIGEIGPGNAGILDTANATIESGNGTLLIDQDLIKNINFIKDGEFDEKKGSKTLKLIGSVKPVNKLEVEKVIKERLIDEYPYSYKQLEGEIRKKDPRAKISRIQGIIKENNLKNDKKYSAYNFRNRNQEEKYKENKIIPSSVPSIFNMAAIQFVLKVLSQEVIDKS